jgi:hypothetical protein
VRGASVFLACPFLYLAKESFFLLFGIRLRDEGKIYAVLCRKFLPLPLLFFWCLWNSELQMDSDTHTLICLCFWTETTLILELRRSVALACSRLDSISPSEFVYEGEIVACEFTTVESGRLGYTAVPKEFASSKI